MNHKTDMHEALQLCIDAMLHDGIPTDPEHPKRIALDAAEAALACRPDAQSGERYDLLQAAVNCPHEIESNRVVLHYSDKQPGHNALAQLHERLARAAAPQAEAAQGVAAPSLYFYGDHEYGFECPDDAAIVSGRKVGDRYTLNAAWYAEVQFEVTKVPDETSDDYEVREVIAAPSPDREHLGEAPLDLAKTFKQWVRDHEAELNSREYSRIDRALDQFIMALALRNASPSRECGETKPAGPVDQAIYQAIADNYTRESAELGRPLSDFERVVLEYIAFNDGFINTRIRARQMLDGVGGERQGASAPTLGNEQINLISEKWSARWSTGSAWNTKRCIDNALREACTLIAADAPPLGETNTDSIAVDTFAQAMKEKMADAHAKGRSGWECMSPSDLSRMLREHVEKGDPRDVANFCMMLWHHSAQIAPQSQAAEPKGEPAAWINYPCKIENNEFAGHGEPELTFKRQAYGYDLAKAEPLYRAAEPKGLNEYREALRNTLLALQCADCSELSPELEGKVRLARALLSKGE